LLRLRNVAFLFSGTVCILSGDVVTVVCDVRCSRSLSWLKRHCFLVFIGLYACLLLLLALHKSSAMYSLMRYFGL